MSPSRTTGGAAAALTALALAAVVPSTAGAVAFDTTSTSASTVSLGAPFRAALRQQGVRLVVGRPATQQGTRLRLPVTDAVTSPGITTLAHTGTLTFRRGSRSARLTGFRTVVRSRTATISAAFGATRRTVFTVTGGRIDRSARTGEVGVSGGTVRLSGPAVRALRTGLRARGLRTGVVGRLGTTVRPAPSPAAPATPPPVPTPTPAPTPVPVPTPAPTPTAPTTPATPTTPTTPTTPDACASDVTAATAGASWAVKSTFLSYVQGPIAKGTVAVCDGAAAAKDQAGRTTLVHLAPTTSASYLPDSDEVRVATTGSIRATGHDSGTGPQLDVAFANIRIRSTDGAAGELVADVTSRPFGGMDPDATPTAPETQADVVVATLEMTGRDRTTDGVRTWTDVPAVLTEEGATAFGGFYAEGEALAPITFHARAASLTWTQVNVFGPANQTPTNRTWLGYVTNSPAIATARGTFTPSAGAVGPTVTPTSPRGPDATTVTRFAVVSSTLSAATRTGVVQLRGLVTFDSPGPSPVSGHDFTITVKDPRIAFDGTNRAKLFATGTRTTADGTREPYDDQHAVFDLAVGTATRNADGTATFPTLTPSIARTGWAFPANYPGPTAADGSATTPSGPDRTPNTFGSFALTVPAG